ncbi:MAG: exodeoxyribonuclease VII small subunit [Spirochaetota bacterium]
MEKKEKSPDKLTFEEALKELEDIARKLEEGTLDLDGSIERFERGVVLKKICREKLEEAERKIEILQKTEDSKGAKKVRKKKLKIKEDTGEIDDNEELQGSLL